MLLQHPRHNSIFWRLFAGFLIVVAVTAAISIFTAYLRQIEESRPGQIDGRIGGRKSVFAALTVYKYAGREKLVEWLLAPDNSRPTVFIINEKGEDISGREVPLLALDNLATADLDEINSTAFLAYYPLSSIEKVTIDGEEWTAFASMLSVPEDLTVNPLEDKRRTIITVVAAILISLLGSAVLAFFYTRPLRQLDAGMREFARGRFDIRLANQISHSGAEIRLLAEVFDRMAEQIEKLVTRQQRLFHDVSHELRSPLARIELAADLARRDPARAEHFLGRIEKEVKAMDSLVGNLLKLARFERGIWLARAPHALRRLAAEAVENAQFEAHRKQISVTLEDQTDGDGPVLSLNAESIGAAMQNLLRNSIRVSDEGTHVKLIVERTDFSWRLRVRDEGPGIPPGEIDRLFDPFFRGEGEMTGTGFGLGLTIAKNAVTTHSGSIRARNLEPHGVEVIIDLPLELEIHPEKGDSDK
ncbi:HAMP domain-containing sensor histidine kinase [Sutterella sp.]|uniref:HAMP domain-containing sensor histidine kinase n=1 Tax=Sutterella sp. TaxID=1981025 RepID=UPI0026DFD5B1|nr:HAMP domain-containing sensor histidine kinase [Sutterella sp.]MDO5530711.1 HAMP domain-containing sensor histidine kinase [Sutterella sp.]